MKAHPIYYALGTAAVLAASLFSYSRLETIGGGTTKLNLDGASLAVTLLFVVLFFFCRRMGNALSLTLRRVGLPSEIRIPAAFRIVFFIAIPFFIFGYSESTTDDSVIRRFSFGMSSLKWAVFVLAVFLAWLTAFLQQLRTLYSHLQANSNAIGTS